MQSIKLVCVGDGAVGKTSLLQTFALNQFPDHYEPTVFDNYATNVQYNTTTYNMCLWDSAGQEDYQAMRQLSYANTDVFLLCFSCISPTSFKHVDRWVKEIRDFDADATIVIACTKVDSLQSQETMQMLREHNVKPISTTDLHAMKTKYPTIPFIECSAKTGWNVKQVFQMTIDAVLEHQARKRRRNRRCYACSVQ